MSACRVTCKYNVLKIHSKLVSGLCYDPNVSLIAIIHRVGIRVFGCKSVVDAENWNAYIYWPLSGITLVSCWVLAAESASVEMHDCISDLRWILWLFKHLSWKINIKFVVVKEPHFHMSRAVILIFTNVISVVHRKFLCPVCKAHYFLVTHLIIAFWLFHVENFGQHRHKKDLVDWDSIINNLRSSLYQLEVLHIEES